MGPPLRGLSRSVVVAAGGAVDDFGHAVAALTALLVGLETALFVDDLEFALGLAAFGLGLVDLRVLVHARRAGDRALHFLAEVIVGAAVRDGPGVALAHGEGGERC